ncbi:MAG TPA: polysaccharide deacetylase family protein [Sinomonas sp.]|nr:polysaccharide deacetylase family protein [Sinomonas sp.]
MPTPSPESVDPEPTSTTPPPADILKRLAGHRATRWGLDLPGILMRTGAPTIALTFDACGGPGGSGFDANLIQTLRRLQVPATLFLNARWIEANTSVSSELAADPLFEIANHGMAHVPLSTTGRSAYGIPGTTSLSAVLDEVSAGAKAILALTGRQTPWFRTGTAFYDDIAVQAVSALGFVPVNFSVNGDGGATFPPATVAAQLAGASAGDIVIGHMNQPRSGTSSGYAAALPRLIAQGANFTTLSRTGSPIPVPPPLESDQ